MWSKAASVYWFFLSLILIQCGPGPAQESDLDAYPRLASKWQSPEIPVCWEVSADSYGAEKQWVQSKVEEQFEGRTNLDFTGWSDCDDESDFGGIRIGAGEGNPRTLGLGRSLAGTRNGMMLNFTFTTWSPSCQNNPQRCIESIAVHEFGHAIGLAHEQNRPDTPESCTSPAQGSDGDQTVGSWDPRSVMNYCNPIYNNNGNLSDTDIAGINVLYGEPL